MGCAHSSSFTSLRLSPDAGGFTTATCVMARVSGAGSGRRGVLWSEVKEEAPAEGR